jgi:hypothetical protein
VIRLGKLPLAESYSSKVQQRPGVHWRVDCVTGSPIRRIVIIDEGDAETA